MTDPKSEKQKYEAARDEAATDWCIEKGAYHFEHLAFEAGADWGKQEILSSAEFKAILKWAVTASICEDKTSDFKPISEALAAFKKKFGSVE